METSPEDLPILWSEWTGEAMNELHTAGRVAYELGMHKLLLAKEKVSVLSFLSTLSLL